METTGDSDQRSTDSQSPMREFTSAATTPTSAADEAVLSKFDAAILPASTDPLVHDLFEQQVQRTADYVALIYEDRRLTYADINRQANQLAVLLRAQGAAVDQPVGICVERGPEMIIALLGILKAGCAYLPLDSNYPVDRLHYMLEDSKPSLVLTQARLSPALPKWKGKIIDLDDALVDAARYSSVNVRTQSLGLSAENLVYLIYTSGSTGAPKGTGMPHRSMVNLIEWHRRTLTVRNECRVIQFAPLSFDVAFQEIFSTLCTGGTLLLVDDGVRRDPQALLKKLTGHSIERVFLPPVILYKLCERVRSQIEAPMSLRDVIVAGEQLRVSPAVSRFFQFVDGCRLHNHYGPTETHVVTAFTLGADPNDWSVLPPIGTPVSNTQIYLLDEDQQPVPPGTSGEIYVGGVGVARGYIGRAQLTAQRFVANLFGDVPASRLYRTGDLGCLQPNGDLLFHGRNDFQLKIRGFRVEPGEVEAVLESFPGIRQAVVTAREDEPGERRLIGYVVPEDTESVTQRRDGDETESRGTGSLVAELRIFARKKLPHFMVPAAIVSLDELPLSPNGKVDRAKLPAPDIDRPQAQGFVAPSTPTEEMLAGMWASLLKKEQVSVEDNFFEIGGDSLMGLELVSAVAERLNVEELSVISLFEYPTVQEMARYIETLRGNSPIVCGEIERDSGFPRS